MMQTENENAEASRRQPSQQGAAAGERKQKRSCFLFVLFSPGTINHGRDAPTPGTTPRAAEELQERCGQQSFGLPGPAWR